MARPDTSIRVSQFLGLEDASPATIQNDGAATLENFYPKRGLLVRRKGQAQLSPNPSPSVPLAGLEWCRINDTPHLIAIHNGSVRDYLDSGNIPTGGTSKLPAAGSVNGAFIDGRLYLGNGTNQNIRYDGSVTGLAADFPGTSTEFLENAYNGSLALYNADGTVNQDVTVCAWVNLDSVSTNERTIVAIYDIATPNNSHFTLHYDIVGAKFRVKFRSGGTETAVSSALPTPAVADTWYFVIAKHDAAADVISIQVNNGTIATAAHSAGVGISGTDFRLGCLYLGPSSSSERLDGQIGPVGVWRTGQGLGGALTTAQMSRLYNGGFALHYDDLETSLLTGLAAWWDNTEASGTRVNKHTTGSALDLTVEGTGSGVGSAAGPSESQPVAQAMVPPAASTLTFVSSGTSGLPIGSYSWVVTHLSSDGNPGEPTAPVSIAIQAARTISIQTIPAVTAGNDQQGRAIWRSDNGGPYYFLSYLADSDTLYVDDNSPAPDTSRQLVLGNTRFPPCRYLIEHQNRLVGAYCLTSDGDRRTLFISNVNEPYYCPASPDLDDPNQGTRAQVSARTGDEITGLCSHGGVVAAFTSHSGHFLMGVEPNDFRLQKFCDHGCVAHRTIKSSRSSLLWLAPDGVYQYNGTTTNRVSEQVRGALEAMTAAEMASAYAYVWDDKYFLGWSGGMLYLDLVTGGWGKNTNHLWVKVAVAEQYSSAREVLYGAAISTPRVNQLETGADDVGVAIPARWRSKDWDMGLPTREKRVQFIETRFKSGQGAATITLFRGTGEQVQQYQHDLSEDDTASATVSRKLESAIEEARNEFFALQVEASTTYTELELQAAGLQWATVT